MTAAAMLGLVLLAMFGLSTAVLSGLVALAWHAGLKRALTASADLLTLRVLPTAGGLLIVLTVVLPAFLSQEPHQPREAAGPWLLILASLTLLAVGHGIWRGWRACAAARSLLRDCGSASRRIVANGLKVEVVGTPEPIVAVIGSWRPRIVAAECVVSACSTDELRQVIAHEVAHVSARDNLKQLMLIASPDLLAWTRVGAALRRRWRAAAELEADRRATGNDPCRRLTLAAALIKVARAQGAAGRSYGALSMPVAADDVEGRVRQLLAPPASASSPGARSAIALALCASLLPVTALPLYPLVHRLIEALVQLGL
jgi:Zn-dependent protease with chaperone function